MCCGHTVYYLEAVPGTVLPQAEHRVTTPRDHESYALKREQHYAVSATVQCTVLL